MEPVAEGTEQTAQRIAPLATLPLFFKLEGRRVLVAGGNEPALWKCELLAAAGASVEVVSEFFCEGFDGLRNECIRRVHRAWTVSDLDGAAIAIGAMTQDDEAAAFAAAARGRGIPVNVIDRPRFCDFQFGAIANRSPLIIAVSTNGAAPVLGQAVRSQVEAMLPENIGNWVEAAARWRQALEDQGMSGRERRAFWRRFARVAMQEGARLPLDTDFGRLQGEDDVATAVDLIEVGSGGPDQLTLGAVRALKAADAVACEGSIAAGVLDFARREATRTTVSADDASEIEGLVKQGRRVALLIGKGGGSDLINALRAKGVAIRFVPVAT